MRWQSLLVRQTSEGEPLSWYGSAIEGLQQHLARVCTLEARLLVVQVLELQQAKLAKSSYGIVS